MTGYVEDMQLTDISTRQKSVFGICVVRNNQKMLISTSNISFLIFSVFVDEMVTFSKLGQI